MVAGFRWFISRSLAGSARPGLLNDLEVDLAFLRAQGIVRIVSLTSKPLAVVSDDFEIIHFPIPDMGIPTPRSCALLCQGLLADLDARPVLLHCHGGLGRTGTIAACCLVSRGWSAEAALRHVREINANYVQTTGQAKFIDHYAAWLGGA